MAADGLKIRDESLRKRFERRVQSMEARRQPLNALYRDLADNFAPMRGRINDEKQEALVHRHKSIYNPTPKLVVRTLSSGLHAGLSSPSRPWFRLLVPDQDMVEPGPVKDWIDTIERRMRRIFAKSNVYQVLPSMYAEWGLFGTTAGLVFEDDDRVIRLESNTTGQFWIAENRFGIVDTLHRRRRMTARQLLAEFGAASLPRSVRNAIENGRIEEVFTVYHLVTPAEDRHGRFTSAYWIPGDDRRDELIAERSFDYDPLLAARWELVPGDVYGTDCPGMMALPAARELQKVEVNISNINEKNENPPLQAPVSLANSGVFVAPGDVTYVSEVGEGIRSIYGQKFDSQGSHESRQLRERELKETFYYDLFLMLTQDERNQRATAEEIRALYEEKVTGLAPVIEQGNPMLASLINATFSICVRRSQPYWRGVFDGEPLFPPPPKELRGIDLEVDFISPLQQAQRAGDIGNMERFAAAVGNLAQASPHVLDKVDFDQYLDEYGSALYVPSKIMRSDDDVAAVRDSRSQQERMAQMAQMAPALKQGADALSTLTDTNANPDSVLAGLGGALTGGVQ